MGNVKKESTKVLSCLALLVGGKEQLSPPLPPALDAVKEHVFEKHWHSGATGSLNTVRGQ